MPRRPQNELEALQSKFVPKASSVFPFIKRAVERRELVFDSTGMIETTEGHRVHLQLEILKLLAENLDGAMMIIGDPNLQKSFQITLSRENSPRVVYQGRVQTKSDGDGWSRCYRIDEDTSPKGEKPTVVFTIEINPNRFSFADVPNLITQLVQKHNAWIRRLSATDEQKELWFMDINQRVARALVAVVQILETAVQRFQESGRATPASTVEAKTGLACILETHPDIIQFTKKLLLTIARQYGADDKLLAEPINHHAWEKFAGILIKKRTVGTNKEQLTRFYERRFRAILRLLNRGLTEATKQILRSAVFDRGGSEVMRLAGIDELIRDFEENYSTQFTVQQLRSELSARIAKLKALESRLSQVQNDDNRKDLAIQIATQKSLVSLTVEKVCQHLNEFIYINQARYFPYSYNPCLEKPADIPTGRYVNCVTIGFLQYLLLKKYLGTMLEENFQLLGCFVKGHFFNSLALPDGSFMSLDGHCQILRRDDGTFLQTLQGHNVGFDHNVRINDKKVSWFNVGAFEMMFMIATLLRKDVDSNLDLFLREALLSELNRLDPHNPLLLQVLGAFYSSFSRQPALISKFGSESQVLNIAEGFYMQAINSDPSPVPSLRSLFYFYIQHRTNFERKYGSFEECLRRVKRLTLEIFERIKAYGDERMNKEYELFLAEIWSYIAPDRALGLYQNVLDYLKRNPSTVLFLPQSIIEKKIERLTLKLSSAGDVA